MTVAHLQPEDFAIQVERGYASLISAAESRTSAEPSLGGKLLYAGELDAAARALTVAANIAGAATLTASADAPARKQALRDGVVDFLVTSLDEALRILKNELRKRETVAVCVAAAPDRMEAEMRERGVLPDLARPAVLTVPQDSHTLLVWRAASAPALWLPKIDAIANEWLNPKEDSTRRWLRLSPRYLGRLAQNLRVLRCSETSAESFIERVRAEIESGRIGTAVEVKLCRDGQTVQFNLAPLIG